MTPTNTLGKGCVREASDTRNIQYSDERIFSATVLPDEYSVIEEIGGIKVEQQSLSLSCVAQSSSKYAEVLNYFDVIKKEDLSAKFIYSRIFLPAGGAYIKDAFTILIDEGVPLERFDPSYPPTETYLRTKNLTQNVLDNAKKYKIKSYAEISPKGHIDILKQGIYNNKGCITGFIGSNPGWSSAFVREPETGEQTWGHAVYVTGWRKINGKEYFQFLNSWGEEWGGENGFGYFEMSYLNNFGFNIFTAVDIPIEIINELKNMLKTIRLANQNDQYIVGKDNKKYKFTDEESLSFAANGLGICTTSPTVVTQQEYDSYPIGGTFPSVALFKAISPIAKDVFGIE